MASRSTFKTGDIKHTCYLQKQLRRENRHYKEYVENSGTDSLSDEEMGSRVEEHRLIPGRRKKSKQK